MADNGCAVCVAAGCCCFAIFIMVILIISAFSTVGPLEVGVRYNNFDRKASTDDGAYSSGFHYVGITGGFVKYPTNVQIMEFSNDGKSDGPALKTWSSDGQILDVEITFFYTIDPKKAVDIYRKYEGAWQLPLVRRAWGTIKTETTRHATIDYFEKRGEIKKSIYARLKTMLNEDGFDISSADDVQFRQVDIPDPLDSAIQDKQIAQQKVLTALANRDLQLVLANTSVIINDAANTMNKIKAASWALANVTIGNATAEGNKIIQQQYGKSYGKIASALGFVNNKQLLQYAYLSAIKDRSSNIRIVAGNAPNGNAVQQLTISGATSGKFKISFGGYETLGLAYDINAADLQTALEGLDSVGKLSVTAVTGGFRIAFLTNNGPLPEMLASSIDLSAGATVNVVTTTYGTGANNYVYQWK